MLTEVREEQRIKAGLIPLCDKCRANPFTVVVFVDPFHTGNPATWLVCDRCYTDLTRRYNVKGIRPRITVKRKREEITQVRTLRSINPEKFRGQFSTAPFAKIEEYTDTVCEIVDGRGPFPSKFGPAVCFVVRPLIPGMGEVQIMMAANDARLDMVRSFDTDKSPIGPVKPIQSKPKEGGNPAWLWVDVSEEEAADWLANWYKENPGSDAPDIAQ